jgi:hypothetical protein
MQTTVLSIIKQIIMSSKEQEISIPAKTRLIKLLYLAEVEHYKHFQSRLTNLRWQFYHYGPYASEIEQVLGSPDIEETFFYLKDGKHGSQYGLVEDERDGSVPSELRRVIDYIVKDWGETDLNKLLDYVYFETEPMIDATRGEVLDFTKVRPWVPSEKLKAVRIDTKKLIALRNKYIPHVKKMSQSKPIFRLPDKTYTACLGAWEDEVSPMPITGQVIIKLGEQQKRNDS